MPSVQRNRCVRKARTVAGTPNAMTGSAGADTFVAGSAVFGALIGLLNSLIFW